MYSLPIRVNEDVAAHWQDWTGRPPTRQERYSLQHRIEQYGEGEVLEAIDEAWISEEIKTQAGEAIRSHIAFLTGTLRRRAEAQAAPREDPSPDTLIAVEDWLEERGLGEILKAADRRALAELEETLGSFCEVGYELTDVIETARLKDNGQVKAPIAYLRALVTYGARPEDVEP